MSVHKQLREKILIRECQKPMDLVGDKFKCFKCGIEVEPKK